MKKIWIKKFPANLLTGRGRSKKARNAFSLVPFGGNEQGIQYRKNKKSFWTFIIK